MEEEKTRWTYYTLQLEQLEQHHHQHQHQKQKDFRKSLFDCAIDVLCTSDVFEKARKTIEYVQLWRSNQLSLSTTATGKALPEYPARPTYLKTVGMHEMKGGSRKALIHSVMHAESYAIDLMWDIVCRFRHLEDLPVEFYNDWVRVAGEESEHFTSWVERYAELGGTYGDLPVHEGLWDSARDTRDSLLARLAIVHGVHEARGLDVYPNAVRRFEKAQDARSLEIMAKNHAEEITHVGAAVKWFTWLCEKHGLDPIRTFHETVQAKFVGKLKAPFNIAARAQACMSAEWYVPLSADDHHLKSSQVKYRINTT